MHARIPNHPRTCSHSLPDAHTHACAHTGQPVTRMSRDNTSQDVTGQHVSETGGCGVVKRQCMRCSSRLTTGRLSSSLPWPAWGACSWGRCSKSWWSIGHWASSPLRRNPLRCGRPPCPLQTAIQLSRSIVHPRRCEGSAGLLMACATGNGAQGIVHEYGESGRGCKLIDSCATCFLLYLDVLNPGSGRTLFLGREVSSPAPPLGVHCCGRGA